MDDRTWLQLPGQNGVLDLVRELLHVLRFLRRLLPFDHERLERVVHGVLSADERVDVFFWYGEAGLDTLLARPVLAVGFALDKDLREFTIKRTEERDQYGGCGR